MKSAASSSTTAAAWAMTARCSASLQWVRGRVGRAIVFGAHDYIELPAHPSLDFRQRFSMESGSSLRRGGQAQFLAKGPLEQGWDLWYDPPGKLNLRIGGFTGPDDASSPVLKADQWNHVVWTYDGTLAEKSVKLYVNGELKQTRNKPGTAKTNDKPLTVGVVVHRVLITHVGGTNRTQNHPEERANLAGPPHPCPPCLPRSAARRKAWPWACPP